MRLFGWWRPKKLKLPKSKIELPIPVQEENHSREVLKQSEQKLKEALKTKKEVSQVLKINDQFAEALQRAMRRSHG